MALTRLYKYGQLNGHSESVLANPQIWFSLPSQLNDPFEFKPKFIFEATSEQIVNHGAQLLRKQNSSLTPYTATAEAVAIYLKGHRDSGFYDKLQNDAIRSFDDSIGICCLSQVRDSILMWSHYSCDHSGYCLEFEATDQTVMFGEAQQVLYSEEYPTIEIFNTSIVKQMELIFLTKYLGWSYEKEWRISQTTGSKLCSYPADLLKGVIFGLRMYEEDKKRIRAWVSNRGHDVKFYQCV